MDVFETVQAELKEEPKEEIAEKLGYYSIEKGVKAVNAFLEHDNLYSWLNDGYFDFKFGAEELFLALCKLYKIDQDEVDENLRAVEAYKTERKRCSGAWVFVDTNFQRRAQPAFALAFMEGRRRIGVAPDLLMYKKLDEVLEKISKCLRKHYKQWDGELPVWGTIATYKYHHYDGSTYSFNTSGKRIDDVEVNDLKATLELKGKDITALVS